MSKVRVTFPDAQLAALAILRAESGVGALFEGVTFGTKPLDPALPSASTPPYVAVALDASGGFYPVVEVATLRVSVWHLTDHDGLDVAKKVRAVLLAYLGDAEVRSFGDLTAPVPTTDPDSGGPLSYFTVAARLRPITL